MKRRSGPEAARVLERCRRRRLPRRPRRHRAALEPRRRSDHEASSRGGGSAHQADDVLPGWARCRRNDSGCGLPPGPAVAQTLPFELNGEERWLSISGVGFDEGTVYAFRDLTEERVLERIRQDLVATVSHELRTPLAAIYGSALTLARRGHPARGCDARPSSSRWIVDESSRLAGDGQRACARQPARVQTASKCTIESCDAQRARRERPGRRPHPPPRRRRHSSSRTRRRRCRRWPPMKASSARSSATSSTTPSSTHRTEGMSG